jgi:hypothetical protein
MIVKELLAILRRMPAHATVIVATDPEQSDFYELGIATLGYWDADDGFGEFHSQDSVNDPFEEWRPKETDPFAVCLIPEG